MQTATYHQLNKESFVFQRRNRLKQHFVNTSKVLLYGYHMVSDGAKITYQVIDGYDWEDKGGHDSKGYAYPAVQTLASIRGVSARSIERHIAELVQAKLLTRYQRRNLPSILIIEDVSEEESKTYLTGIQQNGCTSSPTPCNTSPKPLPRTTPAGGTPTQTATKTNDTSVVPSERRRTTIMSVAYKYERIRSEEQQQVVAELSAWRIGERKAQELVGRYPRDYLRDKMRLLKWNLNNAHHGRPINDTAAWLVRAIEVDYPLPVALQERPKKPRIAVIDINEHEGIYTVVEEPPETPS